MVRKSIVGITKDKWDDDKKWVLPNEMYEQNNFGDVPNAFDGFDTICDNEGKKIGTLITGNGDLGIALMRYQHMKPLDSSSEDTPKFFAKKSTDDATQIPIKPILPNWWSKVEK